MAAKRKRKKHKKHGAKAWVLILLIIAAFVVTFTTPLFDIKTISVVGNKNVKTEEIKIVSGIVENNNIFKISTSRARKNIKNIPYIHDVRIKRKLPGTVVIEVFESKICGYVKYNKGYVGVDKYLKAVKLLKTTDVPDKYLIEGLRVKDVKLGEKLFVDENTNVDILLLYMDEFDKKGISDTLKNVFVTAPSNTGFVTKNGLKVKLGSVDELDYKLKYYSRILEKIGDESGVLDLTVTEKASYHKE